VSGFIIAIDGPSGAGKSTITRLLAKKLGFLHIDTGAMFRAVALMALRAGVDPDDQDGLRALCAGLSLRLEGENDHCRVLANGEDVTAAIRTPEISLLTSRISAVGAVRSFLLELQREMGRTGKVILEGRDIGTVVFPDAQVKFFLSASAEERGRRRYLELSAKGEPVSLEQTIIEVRQRDEADRQRSIAPLRRAEDAVEIDSSSLSIAEVVERMERIIEERRTLAEC
jgi:cytidylate kinase